MFNTKPIKYGATFLEDWPPFEIDWKPDTLFVDSRNVRKESDMQLQDFKNSSKSFPLEFPVDTARCSSLKCKATTLTSNINSAYPIIHEYVLKIIEDFLAFKKKYGTVIEKDMYENMGIIDFVDRLLKKRAAMFCGQVDKYMLINRNTGVNGWENVGTDNETYPLLLADCLSYAEQKISALLSVSSCSQFINKGSRQNNGDIARGHEDVQPQGVIVGLIGTRLEKANVMEYEDIVVDKTQNTVEKGYGHIKSTELAKYRQLWLDIYNELNNYLYTEALDTYKQCLENEIPCRLTKIADGLFFDNVIYKKRLSLSLDTFLLEANSRAKTANTTAFVHLVGIGLGVWCISRHQDQTFLDILADRIQVLLPCLHNVSDIALPYFKAKTCGGFKSNDIIPYDKHPLGGIKIQFTLRDPHAKLMGNDRDKLLVVSYAWDGNALPGNEYWIGLLDTSGDSAAACSSQIAELHNPHINTVNVNGNNLHIASRKFGVLHISEYVAKFTV